ncbi:MAG TPA: hypothetical protein DDW49_04465 [Deltaproteobacteria bacterium]|nr:MAG: hypothetical protein A2048_06630 [Deltaproteobacteria bacterium GWA2_45_12]HBF12633.1 hypothetical protein [Deltaproteobacteria bacterium]
MNSWQGQLPSLLQATPFQKESFNLVKLAGEASYREYFRFHFKDGRTAILMKMPSGFASVSEEVTKTTKKMDELPFINVQKYLKGVGLPVPEIYAANADKSLLVLQDLGDLALEKVVSGASDDVLISSYRKALGLLVQFQQKTSQNRDGSCVAFYRRFDKDLLLWEMNHFLEYGIEDRFQIKVESEDKKIFEEFANQICDEIGVMPQGLTHRDFQSRNLILYKANLWIIDFQDALLGPVLYDLVALLRDSYICLTRPQVEGLVKDFAGLLFKGHPYEAMPEKILTHFDLLTIQRKLKDTGRFQYIHTMKKNSSFLIHVPNSIAYVKTALKAQPKYHGLLEMIGKYVSEFR